MKLENRKKTGVIGELIYEPDKEYHFTVATGNAWTTRIYKKLADLYNDWEDYDEKPKIYWRITDLGEVKSIRLDQHHQNIEKCKEIGNYFETKEEAEKAVEELKALKRLRDEGFRIDNWYYRNWAVSGMAIGINASFDASKMDILNYDHKKDLTICFGEML